MAIAGKAGYVDTGSTVSGIKAWTIDYTSDSLDATDFASLGVKKYIIGAFGWSGSFEGYKAGIPQTLSTSSSITLKLYEDATTFWSGSAYITGVHGSNSFDGIVSYSYDYQGTGTLTIPAA